jgi:1-acyl-sn-glycerol-3-phosphate acyltransferase
METDENRINLKRSADKTGEFVNLEEVIASKNPRLLKVLPGFVINYLKRIVHINEINDFLSRNNNKHGLEFVEAALKDLNTDIRTIGIENVPLDKRYIIASNHPLGGLDGLALIHVIGKMRKDLIFPVNDILLNVPHMRELFIPINKHGKNTENMQLIDKTFASGVPVLYFPAGLCSRKQSRKIIDLEWKKTFVSKAKQYKRDVIAVHIDGRNSNFFYNLANIRKRLGIKANIEMLYLVDEMYSQRNKTITIRFSKPVPYATFDRRFSDKEWAGLLKDYAYSIGEGNLQTFTEWKKS